MVEDRPHNHLVDIWGLGILTYEFCVGKPPFEAHDHEQTYERIKKIDLMFPNNVSNELKDFVKRILQHNPNKRMTLEQIEKHDWLLKYAPQYNKPSKSQK